MNKVIPEMTEMYIKNIDSFLKEYEVNSVDVLSFIEKSQLLFVAIKGFYEKEVSIYNLSEIGSYIWNSLKDEEKNSELGDISLAVQEIEHYLHSIGNSDSLKNFLENLQNAYNARSIVLNNEK